ncbi:hypothetical protein [Mucilaginibacter polytrichastri]|uniref:Uncharacterized protein n=1 Tax=Mucilaginibacter polytrichastri TaxID=1302689 RepID=A0A1Q6A5H3_9SPHI|nr:hypothetical protein [Mucilaginibacter polytrichastri]OKS89242.1 hypothetical protein RG47T_4725 [Mucilaginibacter polytrichastri]SFS98548.1 hypothetical protein SAMN04487890_107283 [Mucilaginibacter polytrichastri]
MSEAQYYSFTLKIPKATIARIHEHRLIDPFKGSNEAFRNSLWKDAPDTVEHQFGGRYGTQFKIVNEVESFLNAFHAVLDNRGIDKMHLDPLLYLILFLHEDFEKQSIENNRFNRLLDYARFIMDFSNNCWSHFEMMEKKPEYKKVFDAYTQEYFFAKTELLETMEYEDLIEFVPEEKNREDIVKYLRVDVFGKELYVPEDLTFNVTANEERLLRSISGEPLNSIELPKRFREQLITYTLTAMLEEHKQHNTIFYQEFVKSDFDITEMKKVYKQYKKRALSNPTSLARVGVMVGDYLKEQKIYKTKADIASFLFEYFALFKAFRLRKPTPVPEDYSYLTRFYMDNGITTETVRLMMKDVGEI